MATSSPIDADTLLVELVATPEGRADPYPRYASLRAHAPVHHSPLGFWVATRSDDCQHVLRDSRVGKDFSTAFGALGLTEEQLAEQAAFRNDHSSMLFAAGFETTTNFIGNALLALLRHPDQLGRLRRERALLRPRH